MKIRTRIVFYVSVSLLAISLVSIGYIANNVRKQALTQARSLADSRASELAANVMAGFNVHMGVSRSMSSAFESFPYLSDSNKFEIVHQILKNNYESSSDYVACWLNMELQQVRKGWTQPFGREYYVSYNEGGRIGFARQLLDLSGDDLDGNYYLSKIGRREIVFEPEFYTYQNTSEQELMVSFSAPVIINAKFAGSAGVDIALNDYYLQMQQMAKLSSGYTMMLSSQGMFVTHPNQEYMGQTVASLWDEENFDFKISDNVRKGNSFSYTRKQEDGGLEYLSFSPVFIGNDQNPWSVAVIIPLQSIVTESYLKFIWSILIALLLGLTGLIVLRILINRILSPINKVAETINMLEQGHFQKISQEKISLNDEISVISGSLQNLTKNIKNAALFAKELGTGNLNANLENLRSDDELGQALIEMQQSLQKATEESLKRQEVERKQNWANTGHAKFGEILRMHNDNTDKLTYNIISNLTLYLDAVQGGLFVINNNEQGSAYIELVASHAYNRQRMNQKRIEAEVSLIGRVVKEKETVYLTEIPEHYVHITSGLGEANPRALLIVPLKLNDVVHGAVEIASFNQMEPYQIEFVEKVGESIASTISNLKINQQTAKLLDESRRQSEELALKEELMRMNMEEQETTQEEASRKQNELSGILNSIAETASIVHFDMDGYITETNDSNLVSIGFGTTSSVLGRSHADFSPDATENPDIYQAFWASLRQGKTMRKISKVETATKDFWISQVYTPIFDEDDKPYKVISIGLDITHTKELELKVAEMENLKEK